MLVSPADEVQSSPAPDRSCAIKYCGPVFDPSGYAEFARGFVKATHRLGVPLCLEVVSYDKNRPDLGADQTLLEGLKARELKHRVKVVNTPPDQFVAFRDPGCVNIGFTMSETTHIPAYWVEACNKMDGVLVPCSWNREVFERSGVRVPVRVVIPGMDMPTGADPAAGDVTTTIPAKLLTSASPRTVGRSGAGSPSGSRQGAWRPAALTDYRDRYKFYSVFQWTDRKNPGGLLRAYLAEFRQSDNVCLILKTYRGDFGRTEQGILADEIAWIRDSANVPDHAPILLVSDLLSQEQVHAIHRFGDCFVLPHRAEGVGMPHMEAMAHGKPAIATGFSGNMEFMTPENSMLLPYQLRPVTGMSWVCWYASDMMWAEPDLSVLRTAMRRCYVDQAHAEALGRKAKVQVRDNFSWTVCARRFVRAVAEIADIAESQRQVEEASAHVAAMEGKSPGPSPDNQTTDRKVA